MTNLLLMLVSGITGAMFGALTVALVIAPSKRCSCELSDVALRHGGDEITVRKDGRYVTGGGIIKEPWRTDPDAPDIELVVSLDGSKISREHVAAMLRYAGRW